MFTLYPCILGNTQTHVFFLFQFEAQTSFGSIYKTRIEGNSMFCDYYNSQTKTYCKRLKVMCPEHVKEPRVSRSEVSIIELYMLSNWLQFRMSLYDVCLKQRLE